MKKLKFVILSYYGHSGGSIAREYLCKQLNELGYKTKLLYPQINRYPNGKKDPYIYAFIKHFCRITFKNLIKGKMFNFTGCKLKFTPFVRKNTVVVYPEVTYGNPIKAKKVVRWLLYYYPFKGDKNAYDKNDLVFAYRPVFNDYEMNPECMTLKISYYDLEMYKRTNYGERKGKCYLINKGRNRGDLPKEFDGIILDDLPEEEKVKIFNKCEYFISYDTQTSYSGIAAMCGCISVVVPEPGKGRGDYLKEGDVGYGRAYGFSEEELKYARETKDKILPYYQEINKAAKAEVEKFVSICTEYFGDKEKCNNESKRNKNIRTGGVRRSSSIYSLSCV